MLKDRCLIYALGGGWGHLNRALSLARLAQHKYSITIITNSPYSDYIKSDFATIIGLSPSLKFSQTYKQIQDIIINLKYDCLIIDTFPRGLGGEIADILPQIPITVPKILINRDLNPQYIQSKNIYRFVQKYFYLVIIPGEITPSPLSNLPQAKITQPWLIRNAPELPDLNTIAKLLQLDLNGHQPYSNPPVPLNKIIENREKIVLVIASGLIEELANYGLLTQKLSKFKSLKIRCLAPIVPPNCPPELHISYYPALECLNIADVVIGSGGYNTVSECLAVKVPLVVLPHQRIYDRQLIRTQELRKNPNYKINIAHNPEEAIALALKLPLRHPQTPAYTNGAAEGLSLIEDLL